MSALSQDNSFRLDTLTMPRRTLTRAEATELLVRGELPDDVLVAAAMSVCATNNTHVFRYDPKQPRDPNTGKWVDEPISKLADLVKLPGGKSPASGVGKSGKPVVPAVIYKKHADGAVVAESTTGERRVRWDAGKKKFVVEKPKGDGWVETDALTKTAAYAEMKKPGHWVEPSQAQSLTAPISASPASSTITKAEPFKIGELIETDTGNVGVFDGMKSDTVVRIKFADGHTSVSHIDNVRAAKPTPKIVPSLESVQKQAALPKPVNAAAKEPGAWGPFLRAPQPEVQSDYGHLMPGEDNADFQADPSFTRSTYRVADLTPTQKDDYMAWGDGEGDADPFVIVKDGTPYLIDGHHRAARSGPNGLLDVWVLNLKPAVNSGQTGTKTESPVSSQTPEPSPAVVEPTVKSPVGDTTTAKSALDVYRVGAHVRVNRQLRTGVPQTGIGYDTNQVITALDDQMSTSTLPDDTYVWRGVNVSPGDLVVGATLRDPAFMSTSRDRKQAEHFAFSPLDASSTGEQRPVMLNIKVPAGSHAIDIGGGEQEVLLDRDSELRVTNVITNPKTGVIIMNVELKRTRNTTPVDEFALTEVVATAATAHTGAMIALVPFNADAQRLSVDGGEDPEQLHVTLAYLGEAALIPVEVRQELVDAVAALTQSMPTIVGDVFAVNMFNPPDLTAGGEPCVTLGVSGSQLEFIRARVCGAVFDVLHTTGVEVHPQHKPWVPHITLVYTEDADLSYFTDRTGPVTFDAVRLAFGGEVYDIPLGDNVIDEIVSENTSEMYEFEFTASGEPIVPNVLFDWRAFQKERDVNIPGGPGHNLRNYWVRGKGAAKIRWNTPGDWTRCVAQLGKYVKDPKGLCAEYHKQATGMWTGDKRHRRMNAGGDITASDVTMRYPTVEAVENECPPGHHMMPGGECMPDDEMNDTYAAEIAPVGVPRAGSAAWRGVLTVEGVESGDGRMFDVNALTWDELPLPLRWQKEGAHGGQNDVTVAVGNVDKIWREPAGDGSQVNMIMGEGTIDLGNPDGREVFRRMRRGYMRGNSVDVDSVKGTDVELVFPQTSEEPVLAGEKMRPPISPFAQPELTKYKKGRIRGTTLVEIPAFSEARLALVGTSDDELSPDITTMDKSNESRGSEPTDEERMVDQMIDIVAATSVIEISDAPPREWFNEPTDVEMTGALTITDEGRVYGYVAPADTRHRSFRDRSVYVPQKKVDYSRFHGGETIVADGGRVATGTITMDCGHATTSMNLTASQAADHYDNTCSMVASVRVGENRDGVWVAGALLPDVTPAQVRKMMASRLSGDWRTHLDKPGWREFVAALLVPVPGFAMARTAPSVSLREGALVASSVPVEFARRERSAVEAEGDGEITQVDFMGGSSKTDDVVGPDGETADDVEKAAASRSRVTLATDRVRQARLASLRSRVTLADKTPYGDVKYADPGYQADGVKRYPIDTEKHIRAAWAYINVPENAAKYDKMNLKKVKARIRAAMNRVGADVQSDEE